jgi:AraC-like DNA-binding protein
MLRDPQCAHLPVLTIALDCGFGSIGPFNRAFKARTGKTPTQFRSDTPGSGRHSAEPGNAPPPIMDSGPPAARGQKKTPQR